MQKLLAKHHCPELLEEPPPTEASGATEKKYSMEVYLRLQKGGDADAGTGTVVKLDECWLHGNGVNYLSGLCK